LEEPTGPAPDIQEMFEMEMKGIPTTPLVIAGKEYNLRFDVAAQIQAAQSLKLLSMGMPSKNWWSLLDPPYDVVDLVAMIQAGVNGGKRFNGEKDFIDLDAAQKLLQDHFDCLYEGAAEEDEAEAMKAFDKAQIDFMKAISDIARSGVGFRKKGLRKKQAKKE
jgi:hypothetical protein